MHVTFPFSIQTSNQIIAAYDATLHKLKRAHPKLYLSSQMQTDIKAAFVEAVANAIKHAQELKKKRSVRGHFFLNEKMIGFEVVDHGSGFNLKKMPVPDLSDLKASGRGIFMMKQLGDKLEYKKNQGHQVLIFGKNLVGQTKELDLLYNLSEAIIRRVSLDEVYEIILGQALDIFHVERASILIYDPEKKALTVAASRGISKDVEKNIKVRSGEGVSGYVYRHGKPLLISDVKRNKQGIEQKKHYKTSSFISAPMICSPLRMDEKSLGVINLTDRIDGKKFTKNDLTLLSTIANQAMACLYIRGLIEEVKASENLKQELEIVRGVQSSYLPSEAPVVKGFDLAGRCEMAQTVGGDYFDYFLMGTCLYLVIADVSGHDMKSAVTMVNFRSQLKASLNGLKFSPEQVLTFLNKNLYEDLSRFEQFISCVLIKVDIKTGNFEMANSGHYSPVFFSDRLVSLDSGVVLGVKKDEKYQLVKGKIAQGDGMILYTDGAVESLNSQGRVFGLDHLKKIVATHRKKTSQVLVDTVVDSILSWREGSKILDDVTVMTIKRI